jgi:thiamine transport system substrate-binding protein
MKTRALAPLACLLVALFAGCSSPPAAVTHYRELPGYARDTTGRNSSAWPRMEGAKITLLDQYSGAFEGFDEAAAQFKFLTGIEVKAEGGGDAGEMLAKLDQANRAGHYDVVYGLDNALVGQATRKNLLVPYQPGLADRIGAGNVFFSRSGPWYATPTDYGYVAIDVDQGFGNGTVLNITVDTLAKVRTYADQLVVENPAHSSPGLLFLLSTIAKYGEYPPTAPGRYDWKDYWTDLFRGDVRGGANDANHDGKPDRGVLVAHNWEEAYVQHFSNGYGSPQNGGQGLGDRPLVVSYTESPAVEVYFAQLYGTDYPPERRPGVVLEDNSTFRQVETMAIANGTRNQAAAEAWIEFTLTDYFQGLMAPKAAVYPVVGALNVAETFQGFDPTPGTFRPAFMDQHTIDSNLARWEKEWKDLCQSLNVGNCV